MSKLKAKKTQPSTFSLLGYSIEEAISLAKNEKFGFPCGSLLHKQTFVSLDDLITIMKKSMSQCCFAWETGAVARDTLIAFKNHIECPLPLCVRGA